MSHFLSLFHCDTPDGNRLHEERFQSFVLCRDPENLQRIEPSQLTQIIGRATDESWNNSEAVLALTNILTTSLERDAYERYAEDIGFILATIFYDDQIVAPDGVSVDFEATKNSHYRKYRLFKFASFLDLLHPNYIYWRGQAESESIRLAQRGLDRFEKTDLQGKAAILARWIRQPGPSAFSAKQEIKSREIVKRRALLVKFEHLTAREVAQRLDLEGIKPSRGYSSHMEHYQRNPNSFQAKLSKERSDARKMSKPPSR